MIFRLNPSSGVPVYLQLIEQVKHAVETGALRPGDRLPTLRKLAGDVIVNPNTVVRAYRELQHEGVIDLRHGSGAYIRESPAVPARITPKARSLMQSVVERLLASGLTEDEIRRLCENELALVRAPKIGESRHG